MNFLFLVYMMLSVFVTQSIRRNARAARPSPEIVTLVGWGLFSLSSTLAVLLGCVALALAMGAHLALPPELATPLF